MITITVHKCEEPTNNFCQKWNITKSRFLESCSSHPVLLKDKKLGFIQVDLDTRRAHNWMFSLCASKHKSGILCLPEERQDRSTSHRSQRVPSAFFSFLIITGKQHRTGRSREAEIYDFLLPFLLLIPTKYQWFLSIKHFPFTHRTLCLPLELHSQQFLLQL